MKKYFIAIGLTLYAFMVVLTVDNTLRHFQAEKMVQREIYSVQRQIANSTSISMAESYSKQLLSNIKSYKLNGDLGVYPWEKGDQDFSVKDYTHRIEGALITLKEAELHDERVNRTEVLRVIQDAFTDGRGSVSTPLNIAPALRWGGDYTFSRYLYDLIFSPVMAMLLFLLGIFILLVIVDN